MIKMVYRSKKGRIAAAASGIALLCGTSCVKTDGTLGQDYIPSSHIWKVATAEVELKDIEMVRASEIGGYNSRRVTIGAILDDDFGWSERSSAFPLLPLVDTASFKLGEDAVCTGFHFALAKDTLSFREESQEHIIQNIRIYELLKPLDDEILYSGEQYDGLYDPAEGIITEGVPTYNGGDSLSFNFKKEFGQKYLDALKDMKLGSTADYAEKLPGIYMTADRTTGSGRLDLFKVAVGTDEYNYLTGNYAKLNYRATFDERGPIDTSIIFVAGLSSMIGSQTSSVPTQYAFNFSKSEQLKAEGPATDRIYIEGGSGLKPVIRASRLKETIEEVIAAKMAEEIKGFDELSDIEKDKAIRERLDQIIVNRATLVLPYEHSDNYEEVSKYPKILSPTCRLLAKRTVENEDGTEKEQEIVTFAGLTDASVSSENQGNINRSMNRYQPDISHHAQELIRLGQADGESDEDYAKRVASYDIWLLIMHPETTTTSNNNDSSYNDYLNALAYSSYYNNLYGYGGYGGYGYGYGGYGYGYDSYYNNYYNYMMMAQYAQSGSTTTTSSTELDKDRYYNCRLTGPEAAERQPSIKITFSFPKE